MFVREGCPKGVNDEQMKNIDEAMRRRSYFLQHLSVIGVIRVRAYTSIRDASLQTGIVIMTHQIFTLLLACSARLG